MFLIVICFIAPINTPSNQNANVPATKIRYNQNENNDADSFTETMSVTIFNIERSKVMKNIKYTASNIIDNLPVDIIDFFTKL